jgi:hypothetical protein
MMLKPGEEQNFSFIASLCCLRIAAELEENPDLSPSITESWLKLFVPF